MDREVSGANDVMTATVEGASAPSRSVDRRLRVARDRPGDSEAVATRATERAIDRALELLERSRLSSSELRILLAVRDGEVSVSALAEAFDRRPLQLRRTAARLYGRGLLRWRGDAATKEAVFGITPAGRAMVRPLLSVDAGSAALTTRRRRGRQSAAGASRSAASTALCGAAQ